MKYHNSFVFLGLALAGAISAIVMGAFYLFYWWRHTKEWKVDGKLHREDGPARIEYKGMKEWWVNGERHREDGPAITSNGLEVWFNRGKRHRLDGPAYIGEEKTLIWFVNDQYHRLYGPAFMRGAGCPEEWYIQGESITSEVREWMEQMSIRPDWENWGDTEKMLFRLRF